MSEQLPADMLCAEREREVPSRTWKMEIYDYSGFSSLSALYALPNPLPPFDFSD
jgi:hypothetical protein